MRSTRLKFVTVVGARPQFIKAAVLSQAIRRQHDEVLVHTGQHYDPEMSAVFFDGMGLPPPTVQLACGSGTHAEQTAAMLVSLERVLAAERPDWVVVFGDTNSTLAGALAAAKLHLPVAHIEAGLRSFNRAMPEEINRVLVDHVSQALLCPSQTAVDNLAAEGIRTGVHLIGDVMADAFMAAAENARQASRVLEDLKVRAGQFVLATVHRAENTDVPDRLRAILTGLTALDEPVVFPVHPRTRKALDDLGYVPPPHMKLIAPLGYGDMARLVSTSRLVMTDSGGLQKEAYWAGVPCVTLRDETEWIETVESGWNVLVGADASRIVAAASHVKRPASRPTLYGAPGAGHRSVAILERAIT